MTIDPLDEKPTEAESRVIETYGDSFQDVFEYLEQNDKYDLVILLLGSYAVTKEGRDKFIEEVKTWNKEQTND